MDDSSGPSSSPVSTTAVVPTGPCATPHASLTPSVSDAARGDLARVLDLELSGSLNVRRTVLRILDLVHTRFADWTALALKDERAGSVRFHGGDDPTFAVTMREGQGAFVPLLSQVMDSGRHELLHVDLAAHPHDALSNLIPHPGLREEAARLRPADVLAVPLTARGTPVGVLLLVRKAGQGFDSDDVTLVQQLADRAALALDSARTFEEHARVTRVLEDSLRPPALPQVPGVDVAACFRAAAAQFEISGDFYDVHGTDDDWLVVLGDVCGKGVEAAVLNGRARQSIRTAARFDRRPSQILTTLNDVLYEDASDRFVTVVCGRLRPVAGGVRVEVGVAGHPPPIVVRADGSTEQPVVTGRLAGALPNVDDYDEVAIDLGPEDSLVFFSDGIYEARGEDGLYGLDRLRGLLSRYAGAGATAICEAIERDVVEHIGGRGHDDMTALVLTPRRVPR